VEQIVRAKSGVALIEASIRACRARRLEAIKGKIAASAADWRRRADEGVEGVGGYDSTTQNLLGTADFSVTVVPEPGTASLLGLYGLSLVVTRFSAVAWRAMVRRRLKSC
jgi:hypothetical protein